MSIIVATVSILAISAVAGLFNRALSFTVCPICAGVFFTWAGLVGAHFLGYRIDLVVPALLMGGTVVGVVYQLEKKSAGSATSRPLLWKAFFIPAGFVAAYAVLYQLWIVFLLATAFLAAISARFFFTRSTTSARKMTGDLEKRMEDCC